MFEQPELQVCAPFLTNKTLRLFKYYFICAIKWNHKLRIFPVIGQFREQFNFKFTEYNGKAATVLARTESFLTLAFHC